jgi:hypothetical protein
MTLTIELGWWLAPTLLTVAAMLWSFRERDPLVGAFQFLIALLFSAMTWVVYLSIALWSAKP